MKTRIATEAAPAPKPLYSQAVRKGSMLAVSGQGGADAVTGAFAPDLAGQAAATLENVRAILEAAGSSFEDVIMVRVYLTTRDDFAGMNAVYNEFIAQHVPSGVYPARTTIFPGLPQPEMLIEIDVLAVVE